LLRSMADSTLGLESLGGSVITMRLTIFAISAFLAGIGGALVGVAFTGVNGLSFSPDTSILYFTVLVVVVGRAPWYAFFAAVGVAVIPTYYQGNVSYYIQMVFGVTAVLLGLGIRVRPPRWASRYLLVRDDRSVKISAELQPTAAKRSLAVSTRSDDIRVSDGMSAGSDEAALLRLEEVTVRFGGVLALDGVSLSAHRNQIIGLIGPNGAGKTTVFNVCSGLVRQQSGRVWYSGDEISDRSVGWRARQGIGRTFQHMELFDSLTVSENVQMGREADMAGSSVRRLLVSGRGDRTVIEESAEDAMRLCGIEGLRGRAVDELSTGQRRLVELARCLAGSFKILLLDEPSAGLDTTETAQFAEVLERIVEERGTGILLIEHDVNLVMRVCQYVHVLDFGRSIFEGAPEDVRASPTVREAYLGVGAAQA
jgi:ABC-type branched-subunit amino acid transport system ATPase component